MDGPGSVNHVLNLKSVLQHVRILSRYANTRVWLMQAIDSKVHTANKMSLSNKLSQLSTRLCKV